MSMTISEWRSLSEELSEHSPLFSTFEMEIFGLVREREFTTAFVYMSLSVVVGFVGVVGGATLARRF